MQKLELSSKSAKPDVFKFRDYREFMNHVHEWKRAQNPRFTMTMYSRALELSTGHLHRILHRERHLALDLVDRFTKWIDLKGSEETYFKTLIAWEQTPDETLKAKLWEMLVRLGHSEDVHYPEAALAELMTRWYTLPILEIIRLREASVDPAWVASRLGGKVAVEEVARTLSDLTDAGYLEKNESTYTPSKGTVSSGSGIFSKEDLKRYHRQTIPLGLEALETVDPKRRDIRSTVIAVPTKHIERIREMTREFHNQLLDYVAALEDTSEEVYILNSQLFPLQSGEEK